MKLKIATIAAAATMAAWSAAAANVWWVDAANYGKPDLDGRTEETAFSTIQDALDDEAFEENDTVKVKPGVYDKGETYQSDSGMTNRVVISKAC